MAFQVSPGVNVSEIDLTTIVPAVSTTGGAIAGVFRWGPVNEITLINSETTLAKRFGTPTNLNPETWFVAASFLNYGSALSVVRAANTNGTSPILTSAAVDISFNATLITVASTSNVVVGMTVLSSANGSVSNAIKPGTTVASVVNATAFTIASPASKSLSDGSIQLLSNTAFTAIANTGSVAQMKNQIVKNKPDFENKDLSTFDSDVQFVARYPGELGNSLRVSVCPTPEAYTSSLDFANSTLYVSNATTKKTTTFNFNKGTKNATLVVKVDSSDYDSANTEANTVINLISAALNVGDNIDLGTQKNRISAKSLTVSGNNTNATATLTIKFDNRLKLASNVAVTSNGQNGANTKLTRRWEYFSLFDAAPGLSDYQANFGNTEVTSDEMHIVIVDNGGKFTQVPGTILEVYRGVSRATDAKTINGSVNYYKTVINDFSEYVYAINDYVGAESDTAAELITATSDVRSRNFNGGKDGADESAIAFTDLADAYDVLAAAENADISLTMAGKTLIDAQNVNYLIDNVAEVRKDCVVFASPAKDDVVGVASVDIINNVIDTRNQISSTSYAVMDSGYKYMYDRYNDIYRWIPLNGDVAGICARTDVTNDAWWSPAGPNRGQIKNSVKLAVNPSKADRDELYKNGINPVVTFPGQGTILYGDKTLLSKPSAFDRINVRRLFIVLEKAIARASKYTLFEFNDSFTRSQFKNMITPYLRDIQGRRGITDFLVVCDDRNNTPEVIDRNEFVGDIYVKPNRAINYIQLNFVAVNSGVSFSEVVGQF